ncbi:hypothetical protein [Sphingomonas sp. SORGH_AS_0438]|uniref:hypothetical protein n=1 Tax=Sphingomonas sp. SORGH_AS_0438 TaxID=3041756 RepID=UPI002860ED39|nr:hypothetical protein [Sphingomonas sp. SORGH_AS_0438]MDR6129092.1 anti-sigma regulatory factor (Ser/Thr protein kinase) [Sphingomonas sp. SORGH_AS_0438]
MAVEKADFSVADDLLREATKGLLGDRPSIELKRSGRIGPLVELALASIAYPDQYRSLTVSSPFAMNLSAALRNRRHFGSGFKDVAGAFPLDVINPVTSDAPDWDLWTKHAENIAISMGLNRPLLASLLGALGELQDNVYEHSGAPETGVVAYAVTSTSFEFVVADRGVGALKSLRQNPQYAEVADDGEALQLAITDGVSRFQEGGRGRGFRQLFRALVGHAAELRFRSGDHALMLRPGADANIATSALSQVAPLDGLTISVFCNGQSLTS